MSDPHTAVDENDRFFREIVLCLGGIFAAHDCDDILIRQVTKSLGHIYDRSRARRASHGSQAEGDAPSRRPVPHPAVEELLSRIGS
jgi:hypothetical protein